MKKAFLQLHASILLAGFTGVLGRLISMNEVDIVFYRILVALLILVVFTGLPKVGWRKFFQIAGCGALLAIHWILFYSSIKMSNVSIGVVCYAMVGFFTALLEPWIYHRKVKFSEVGFSLITLLGILLIFSFDPRYRSGIMMGTVSSFVAALFMVLVKKVSTDVKSRDMMVYEMVGGLGGTLLFAPLYLLLFPPQSSVLVLPEGNDVWFVFCHALFCTVLMYMLQLMCLKKLSAFTVNLSYNLEPVYSIIIAFIIFGEGRELNFSFYLGIALILFSVAMQTLSAIRSKA